MYEISNLLADEEREIPRRVALHNRLRLPDKAQFLGGLGIIEKK